MPNNSDEEAFEPSESEDESDIEALSDADVVIVGASGGPGVVASWICQHCTYRNDVDSKTSTSACEVCEAPRYDASDDDFEDQVPARAPKAAIKKRQRKSSGGSKLPASRRRLGLADPMMQRPVEDEGDTEVNAEDVQNMTLKPQLPEAKPPKAVTMPLLPFQRESLGWMQQQEAGPIKGGILADEMGMGKTIQAITLIVANRPENPASAKHDNQVTAAATAKALETADGTSSDDFEDVEVLKTVTAKDRAHAARVDAIDLDSENLGPDGCAAPCVASDSKVNAAVDVADPTATLTRATQSRATLVICPVAALMQWKHEIEKHVAPGTLSVYLYHGPKRTKHPEELAEADVVLTTYSIVESEYRRYIAPPKVQCEYCGDKFYPRQLITHLKYFCGPDAQKSAAQAAQHKKKTRKGRKMQGQQLKGGKKRRQPQRGKRSTRTRHEDSEDSDFSASQSDGENKSGVVGAPGGAATGSSSAAAAMTRSAQREDAEQAAERSRGGVLHAVQWYRIVLDEAHCIKDRSCSTAQAVFKLTSQYRWGLSGTPLQNRVSELYSLVRFLQLDPYSFYYCNCAEGCNCKSLNYDFGDDGKKCTQCGHGKMNHYCWWNKHIANPIKHHGYSGPGASAMKLLKSELLDACLLRRTKRERSADISLPPRLIQHRHIQFNAEEQDYYTALYSQTQATFNAFVTSGTVVNNYAHIFDLLIRLRQAVNHPWLVEYSATRMLSLEREKADAEDSGSTGDEQSTRPAAAAASAAAADTMCGICAEECCSDSNADVNVGGLQSVRADCGHLFCRGCLQDLLSTAIEASRGDKLLCPSCPAHMQRALSVDMSRLAFQEDDNVEPTSVVDAVQKEQNEPSSGRKQRQGASVAMAPAAAVTYQAEEQRLLSRKGILKRIAEADPAHLEKSSTKVEALLEAVCEMRRREPAAKAICFSQFVNALDLIEYRLLKANESGELGTTVGVIKLDGRMSVEQRDRALSAFQGNSSYQLLLMSLKAGGVALNLTAANHVYLMDPWYQAMDRIHRLGQFRPMTVTRLFIAHSIEDRILRLQEKKRLIFEGTVGQSNAALARLTEEDLRFLFS